MSTIKEYICNVRFLIILIIGFFVIGGIGYFVYSNDITDTIASDAQHNSAAITQAPAYTTTQKVTESTTTVSPILKWEQNDEIRILQEFLRIQTFHPDVDYKQCVYYLENLAANLSLPVAIHHPVDDKNPVVVITWEGTEPELPSIVLSSHMDTVPVYEEFWTHPPFAAEIDANGDIYARGAQDTKSLGMLYLAAIRALKRNGVDRFRRTIHVLFLPDEEVGSARGLAGFIKTDEFKAMNIGLLWDEGGSSESPNGPLDVYIGERTIWQIELVIHGHSGHGSRLFDDTPGEKLSYVVAKFMEFRRGEVRKLKELKYPYGNLTSINLTKLKGGVENNVIPAEMSVVFDIRLSINADLDAFEQQVRQWLEEAGGGIDLNFIMKGEKEKVTTADDSNPYWVAFKNAVDELGIEVQPVIRLSSSDGRFIRRMNISCFGFAPLLNTIWRRHDHNEYINADVYLKGIDSVKHIIMHLANV